MGIGPRKNDDFVDVDIGLGLRWDTDVVIFLCTSSITASSTSRAFFVTVRADYRDKFNTSGIISGSISLFFEVVEA